MRLLLQGLLTGNFRRWGVTQYRQYHNTLGHLGHTGYELEFPSRGDMLGNRPELDEEFKWSHADELQWLVSTTNPVHWYDEMRQVDARLKKHSLPTTGSIHLNVDIPCSNYRNIPKWAKGWPIYDDRFQVVKYRLENKYLKGYIVHKDLILQTILFGLFLRTTREPIDLTAVLSQAYAFYTPTELEFRQDLSPLFTEWVKMGCNYMDSVQYYKLLDSTR